MAAGPLRAVLGPALVSTERAVLMHRMTSTKAGILCEFASLGSWALDKRTLHHGSVHLLPLLPPSRQQLNLSGTFGTSPGLLRSIKNRACPCRQKTLKHKGKLSKQQFRRPNSELNIYSKEHCDHLTALSQDKHMLSVTLHDVFPLP